MEDLKGTITFSPELQLSHLVRLEAMMQVSINMQAQIIAKMEGREINEVQDKAWKLIDEKSKDLVKVLMNINDGEK